MTAVAVADGPGGEDRAAILNRCTNIVEAMDGQVAKLHEIGLTGFSLARMVEVQARSIAALATDLASLAGAA